MLFRQSLGKYALSSAGFFSHFESQVYAERVFEAIGPDRLSFFFVRRMVEARAASGSVLVIAFLNDDDFSSHGDVACDDFC